jgi:hypothetical protein
MASFAPLAPESADDDLDRRRTTTRALLMTVVDRSSTARSPFARHTIVDLFVDHPRTSSIAL